jgi:hypothetical protein
MAHILRIILTFQNPSKYELLTLSNLLTKGISINDQQMYIASPATNLLHYSNDKLENIKLTRALSYNEVTPEFFIKFRNEYHHKVPKLR